MRASALLPAAVSFGLLAFPIAHASAAEIKVLSTVALQPAMPELVSEFERTTGHKVLITYGLASVLKTKFLDGEPADVVILVPSLIEDLTKQGKVAMGSRADIARSGVGVAVKAGAPKPDIGTQDALKRTLLATQSVGYSKASATGIAFVRALDLLGIAEEMKPKSRDTGGKTSEMLAAGAFEIGVTAIPELMAMPGVEIIGPLPGDLQSFTILSAGLVASAGEADTAKAFIQFLSAPAALLVYKAKGLGG